MTVNHNYRAFSDLSPLITLDSDTIRCQNYHLPLGERVQLGFDGMKEIGGVFFYFNDQKACTYERETNKLNYLSWDSGWWMGVFCNFYVSFFKFFNVCIVF